MSAATSPIMGYANKLYYATAGIGGTPTWVEVKEAQNVSVKLDRSESDVSTRGAGGFKQSEPALADVTIEFNIPYLPGSTNFLALEAAWLNRSLLGVAAMSGDIATTGSEGIWADMKVFAFSVEENVDKHSDVKITLKPCYSTNAVQWKTISGT